MKSTLYISKIWTASNPVSSKSVVVRLPSMGSIWPTVRLDKSCIICAFVYILRVAPLTLGWRKILLSGLLHRIVQSVKSVHITHRMNVALTRQTHTSAEA